MVNKKCSKLVRLAINATMSGAVVVMGFGGSTSLTGDSEVLISTPTFMPPTSGSVSSVSEANVLPSQPQVEASCRNLWGLC